MQTSYSEFPGVAFAGLLVDTGFRDIISCIASSRQLEQVVVTTAANSENFTVTIDGTGYVYASDTNATKAEISAGLKVLIDAGDDDVTVTDDLTDTLTIESNDHDSGFVITVASPGSGVLTLTQLVAQEQAIGFGKVVVLDENVAADSLTGKLQACRLPRLNADITDRKIMGVAIADTSLTTRTSTPLGGYSAKTTVPCLKKGRIWMDVEDVASVVKGGLVYVRSTATGTEKLGAIRAADDSSDTDPVANGAAQFTGQVSGDLAVVEWNLP